MTHYEFMFSHSNSKSGVSFMHFACGAFPFRMYRITTVECATRMQSPSIEPAWSFGLWTHGYTTSPLGCSYPLLLCFLQREQRRICEYKWSRVSIIWQFWSPNESCIVGFNQVANIIHNLSKPNKTMARHGGVDGLEQGSTIQGLCSKFSLSQCQCKISLL